jgi:hypothetical protein
MSVLGTPDDGGPGERIWEALRREAGLTAEHLGVGATAVGRARYERTATYAQALFALSIGFERAAKLALTLDAAITTGAFLDANAMRAFGHRLDRLMNAVEGVAGRYGLDVARPAEEIHGAILAVLTGFASNVTRYYNLELLSAAGTAVAEDPIAAWHRTISIPVLEMHYTERQRSRDAGRAASIAVPADTLVSVLATSEDGAPIRDVGDVVLRGFAADAGKPWERMYVLQLARYVTAVIGEVTDAAQRERLPVPYLREYFYAFQLDDLDFRKRKIWTIES